MDNTDRHIDVWNGCLQIIKQIIEPQKFDVWFKPIKPVSIVDSTLTIEVPSDFFREYLEGAYLDVISKTLKRVIGTEARLLYVIKPVQSAPGMVIPAALGQRPENPSVSVSTAARGVNPSPFVYPGLHKLKIDPRLNPVYCFGNLVVGECNRMGITAGNDIALAPGQNPFNPLFLFGGSGLGKTHIAQAIGIAIHEKFPELVVLYVTGNEFKTQYMDAVNVRNKLTDFLAFYMKIDVLIMDDVQDLLGQGSQNAFFNVFNHLHQSGKQLVFTSDRAPVDLRNFEDRLLSRFKWGLSVELSRPDFATRLAMLKARCFREGVTIGDDVLEFLANRINTNFRELEGVLISLIAHATRLHRDANIALARSITDKLVSEDKSDITIEKVLTTVCDYFGLTREDLVSKSRKRQIVLARQIAMYLSRNLVSGVSLSGIGSGIGGKDHATVLYACSAVADLMATDRNVRQDVRGIEKLLARSGERNG